MKLKLGFSPCPNDTFIFDAMVHGRIDTEGLEFDYFLADVEELNRKTFTSDVDITKISCYAYTFVAGDYLILDSGSAVGHGNGPLLISKHYIHPSEIPEVRIAIPGKYTTANLLLSIAWPEADKKTEYLFSDIEKILLEEKTDAGLIIHETRFTYRQKGLRLITDLGKYWEGLTGLPIPLGIIVVNRRIPPDVASKINRVLRRSIEYAFEDSSASYGFVASNAREMESKVVNSHIKLYVNEYTLQLGHHGKEAINSLFGIAFERGIIPSLPENIFLTPQ
jgi:1,4-dihydroxy-6-naphthoate synthase